MGSLRSIGKVQRIRRIRKALDLARFIKPRRVRVDSTLDLIPVISPGYARPEHLSEIFAELDRVPMARVLACVSIPPRHFKSTTAHHWIARLLERFPWMKILYLSYGATFAAENVANIQRLAIACGVELGAVQRQDRWTTSEGGGVWSAGFDGSLTGRGFHLIVIDDPVKNRAEAESAIIRAKINRAILVDVMSRGQPSGPRAWPRGFAGTSVVVFATRWHEDDPTGNLVGTSPNAPGGVAFRYYNLPAIDDQGRALAPDFWTLEQLREIEARTPHYDWISLYQGRPEPAGGRMFGDVILIDGAEIPSEGRYAIGVDLSHSAKARSDMHAAALVQRLGDRFYIRDIRERQGRLTSEERGSGAEYRYTPGFVQEIRALQAAYPGARTAQHIGGPEDFVLDLLRGLEEGERVHIEGIRAKADKRERATLFMHDWNHGRVLLPREAPWVSGFVSKLIAFTGAKGGQDDAIDAVVTAHTLLHESDALDFRSAQTAPRIGLDRPSSGAGRRRGGVFVG